MAIITLDDLKTALGIPASNTTVTQLTAAVNAASRRSSSTDRDFGLKGPSRSSERAVRWLGRARHRRLRRSPPSRSSYNSSGTVLPTDQWRAQPRLRRHHVPTAPDRAGTEDRRRWASRATSTSTRARRLRQPDADAGEGRRDIWLADHCRTTSNGHHLDRPPRWRRTSAVHQRDD